MSEYREIIKVYSFDNNLKYTFTVEQANIYFKNLRKSLELPNDIKPKTKKTSKKKSKSEQFKELVKKKKNK